MTTCSVTETRGNRDPNDGRSAPLRASLRGPSRLDHCPLLAAPDVADRVDRVQVAPGEALDVGGTT
jgi:hypothetical protein